MLWVVVIVVFSDVLRPDEPITWGVLATPVEANIELERLIKEAARANLIEDTQVSLASLTHIYVNVSIALQLHNH